MHFSEILVHILYMKFYAQLWFIFCRPTIVRGDIAVDFSVCPSIRTFAVPFLIKVFLFAYISVSIHRIAFLFYIQLHKDIGNTFPGHWQYIHFCKNKYFFIVNLGVLDLEFFTNFGVLDFWLKFLNMVISQ